MSLNVCTLPKPGDFEHLHQEDFAYLESNRFTFSDRLIEMGRILQLTNSDIQARQQIARDIAYFLRPYYPDCEVLIFGSSVNGFGFRDCDLDLLFLPFPGYCNLDFKDNGSGTIPSPSELKSGSYSKQDLLKMKEEGHLKFIQHVFRSKRKHYFQQIYFVPAKCPILNIVFRRNPISCDLSASNRFVVNNTELLCLFGSLDIRVRPLVLVLRYWAKSLGFIAKSLLSSYAFSLMVIFYLQNIEPPVLPSVKSLSEKAGYSRVIDGWETAVWFDGHDSFRSKNPTPLGKLLTEFFEFYYNFDFIQNIVSVYHGRPISVKELRESKDERIKEFPVTSFSIQDAFILSRNISRNTSMKTPFKLSLSIAQKIACSKNYPFQSLFNYSVYQEEMTAMFDLTTKKLPFRPAGFPLYLNYELCHRLGITHSFDPWYGKVCEVVIDVLQYGLLVECEVVDSIVSKERMTNTPAKKKRKLDVDNVGNLQLIKSIQCALHFTTLHDRKALKECNFDSEEDDTEIPVSLRKEFKISKELLKQETDDSPMLWFMCRCYRYSSIQIPDVIVTVSPLVEELNFITCIKPLISFIQKQVKNILEDYANIKTDV